ncbi:hypothetical protein V6N11_036265 [Hibiscus sabdariffa]|uniref:Uncharacterized protein n=1 Tax=Hibiscus sabdariffa TaxID=183260 RepID=A0ABR2R9X4_9ROSI
MNCKVGNQPFPEEKNEIALVVHELVVRRDLHNAAVGDSGCEEHFPAWPVYRFMIKRECGRISSRRKSSYYRLAKERALVYAGMSFSCIYLAYVMLMLPIIVLVHLEAYYGFRLSDDVW